MNLKNEFNKLKTKMAFTLAEVLITLVVIGVIAAITVPVLMSKYEKHVQYTAFMKAYNTVTNALELTRVQTGFPDSWTFEEHGDADALKSYIYPYLKIAQICEESGASDCFTPYNLKVLSGAEMGTSTGPFAGNEKTVILQDGTILGFTLDSDEVDFYYDTNGPKGPNTIGRDIFIMLYVLWPDGKWNWASKGLFEKFGISNSTSAILAPSQCDPSNSDAMGFSCVERLLKDGKMNY